MSDAVLTDLQRLCSEAKADHRFARLSDTTDRDALLWLQGTPVQSDAESIGLRIGERAVVHVRVEDVVQADRDAQSDIFRVAVPRDTSVAVTSTQVRRALAPWFLSPRYWSCVAGEAGFCDLKHGPLYDDRGFINGDLIDCYVQGAEACDLMDRALPP